MGFKVGQKYRIVDIDAWFNNKVYKVDTLNVFGYLNNGDIVQVREDEIDFNIDMKGQECQTEFINQLIKNPLWHDSCIELITDDIADVSKMDDQPDDTISLYHIADVLEDALNVSIGDESDYDKIKLCIKSLRKAGY